MLVKTETAGRVCFLEGRECEGQKAKGKNDAKG